VALWLYDERARSQQLALLDDGLRWSALPTPPVGFPGPLVAAGGRLFAGTTIMGAEAIAELEPGAAAWRELVVPSVHTDIICPPLLVPAGATIAWIDGCDGDTFVLDATRWDPVPPPGALGGGVPPRAARRAPGRHPMAGARTQRGWAEFVPD
jgi:hypothetical protein